jgi:hypothetical protein
LICFVTHFVMKVYILHALFLGSKMHCSKCDLLLRACEIGIFQ